MRVTGTRLTAFWGSLLAILLVLAWVGHESWLVLALWGFAVTALYVTSVAVHLANRRSPVHRGAFAWPVSGAPALALAVMFVLAALAGVYGGWFAILVPVPLALAIYLQIRDRKLRQRMLTARALDPEAPPHVARAGRPREIPEWPEPEKGSPAA